jgi:hypothetical protein
MAIALSVGLYYGRPEFIPAYKSVQGARTKELAPAATPGASESGASAAAPQLAGGAVPVQSVPTRVASGLSLATAIVGWPILVLAVIGAWRLYVDRVNDKLRLGVAAWAIASAGFVLFGILAPGGVGHQRQAIEFIARAAYAGSPAAVIAAAVGAAWAWRARGVLRPAALALTLAAFIEPVRVWWGWMH